MNADRPLRVAVVGSGPAGFYAVGALLTAAAEVDLLERLPTPWGLVRLGVAPDHPKIKSVSRAFEKTAEKPGFRLLANVEVGRDVTHAELAAHYDAVVYTVGAQTDRRLGIEGEELDGSWPATAFVAWYNGHPDFADLSFDLDTTRVVVIGNGNVAVDVARMLALAESEISPTDTADPAITAILASPLKEIVVVGRRGPAQAAFTNPELVELTELAEADLVIDPADLQLDPASEAALEHDPMARRNLETLRAAAARPLAGRRRRIVLRFLTSPVALRGDGRVEAVEVVRNRLEVNSEGQLAAIATDERETILCGLVLRSVGYRGIPIEGVPFDERRATMPNRGGRVLGANGEQVAGLYCAGWIKRGPSGVIGTNKKCAVETIDALLEDAAAGHLPTSAAAVADLDALLAERGVEVVDLASWKALDAAERAAGGPQGRPRVKRLTWDDQLEAALRR
ncbi:MAG: NADP oxidoreductase [Thermoleophilia bacterium]|nr:NADP oxidoreductase [Thermoleophilia bacterium]